MDNSFALGPVLKGWFKKWDWPQSITEGVARAKGWENGPWASQISICMSGRLTPKPAFFMALGDFNRVVAERDFGGISDRRVIDRLRNGQPLTHGNGVPWTGLDFFACYVGELKGPKPTIEMLTQEQVDEWQIEIRACFRELVLASMETPFKVWKAIADDCISNGVSREDVEFVQEVVSGLRDFTVEEASRLTIRYPDKPLIAAMIKVQEAAGGSLERLKKLLAYRSSLEAESFPLPPGTPPPERIFGFDVSDSGHVMLAMRLRKGYSGRATAPPHGRQSNTGVTKSSKQLSAGNNLCL